jgi:hydroxyethylthiazole kinase-like uncharacterized protein yjeF
VRSAYGTPAVRDAERSLMALLPEGTLMQRAAAGLAAMCLRLLGGAYRASVVVLAGSGDNGGDALYAGARLAARGARVTAVSTGTRWHEDAARALSRSGGRLVPAEAQDAGARAAGMSEAATAIAGADLIIDGILGIGGHGGLREPAAALAGLAARAAEAGAIVVAVDVPSGVDADTGVVAGAAIRADVTVTFGALKPGLVIDPGASYAGTVELIDIGLRPHLAAPPQAVALQAADVAALLPLLGAESDKYRRGVLGVLAGSARYTGASALAVGGAVRGGAGMVRLVTADQAAEVVRQKWPEAVITVTDQAAEPPGGQGTSAVTGAGRVQAWVAGPGLGTGSEAEDLLAAVLATPLPVLVDADGLTILARRQDLLARPSEAATLITPHVGELARLLGAEPGDIESHRLEWSRRAAAKLGVTVLLKGSTTLVAPADPAEPVHVNPTGTPWLATAGSGDVLSGLAGALLAQGVWPPRSAAAAAAFLHGLAGRLAARDAPIGASDLIASLPEAFRVIRAAGIAG